MNGYKGARGINQLVCEEPPRLEVNLYNREEAMFYIPLSSYPHVVGGNTDCLGLEYSDWVL